MCRKGRQTGIHITRMFKKTFPLIYLYVHVKLLDDARDGQDVILQQLAGKRLNLDRAVGGLQTRCHLLFDPESLLQQHSQRPLLTAVRTL